MGRPPASITIETDDCHKTVEELKSRGVEFLSDVLEFPWGYVTSSRTPTETGCRFAKGAGQRRIGGLSDELGRRVQPGELPRVAHRVDPGQPTVFDHQADHGHLAADLNPGRRGAVQPHAARRPRLRPAGAGQEPGDPLSAVDRSARGRHDPAAVGDQHDVRRHDLQQFLQLPGPHRDQEALDHRLLFGLAHVHPRPPGGHVVTGSPCDLPDRGGGLPIASAISS